MSNVIDILHSSLSLVHQNVCIPVYQYLSALTELLAMHENVLMGKKKAEYVELKFKIKVIYT